MGNRTNALGEVRGMRRRFVVFSGVALLAITPASVANSCTYARAHQTPVQALQADAVISGRVRNYHRGDDRYRPFLVEVKQVLRGDPGRRISVSWGASNIDVPAALNGEYVFVLRRANPSFARERPADYIISQGVCSSASVFPKGSADANAVREQFGLRPQVAETSRERLLTALFPYLLGGLSLVVGGVLLWSRRRGTRS